MTKKRHDLSCLSERPDLATHPLLDDLHIAELAAIFETLSNETRLRLLHVIVQMGVSTTFAKTTSDGGGVIRLSTSLDTRKVAVRTMR